MDKFIFFGLPGKIDYAVTIKPPYTIGRFCHCSSSLEYAELTGYFESKQTAYAQVLNYRIVVYFDGSLTKKIIAHLGTKAKLKRTMEEMAEQYFQQYIKPNPDNFRKYLF